MSESPVTRLPRPLITHPVRQTPPLRHITGPTDCGVRVQRMRARGDRPLLFTESFSIGGFSPPPRGLRNRIRLLFRTITGRSRWKKLSRLLMTSINSLTISRIYFQGLSTLFLLLSQFLIEFFNFLRRNLFKNGPKTAVTFLLCILFF